MSGSPVLILSVSKPDRDVLVSLHGDFDLECETTWTETLDEACRSANRRVIVDLGKVTFIDCSGLKMLLAARRSAEADSVDLELVNLPPIVTRLFGIAGLSDFFAVDREPMSDQTPLTA